MWPDLTTSHLLTANTSRGANPVPFLHRTSGPEDPPFAGPSPELPHARLSAIYDLVIPMHFGTRRRTLFGMYHPALEPRRRRGVLILNPWGSEYFRAHRSLRHMAISLAERGLDVLRFDYFGTGDSFGRDQDTSVSGSLDDGEMALDELAAVAGVRKVSLVGLRLGATLAGHLAERRPREVDRVVFWDPVWQGADLVGEWGVGAAIDGNRAPASLTSREGTEVEVHGFVLPSSLLQELSTLSLDHRPGEHIRLLTARSVWDGGPDDRDPAGAHRSDSINIVARETTEIFDPSPPCWVEEEDFGAGAIPMNLIRKIAEWME